ncbi:hypothetical protein METHB2_300012 [Candidatus Methylobacter favarea]|uniref:Uncharacterized protein n=1 Tax=Candidatus Methylobacter favarea TaxID=2707345 RepID=A0A8S0WJ02_9GAMM|nr:hypothetical protein METHB2_300012 [Candidatus Methylobacter favarea]
MIMLSFGKPLVHQIEHVNTISQLPETFNLTLTLFQPDWILG